MARVYLTSTQKKLNSMYSAIAVKRALLGVSQSELARVCAITQQALSLRLKNKTLSLAQYVAICEYLTNVEKRAGEIERAGIEIYEQEAKVHAEMF